MRTPNAFLGQSTVAMRQAAQNAKGTQYPIGQILFFHERRLAELEKGGVTFTGGNAEENVALLMKVEHLEKMCQQLAMEVQQLKNQSTEVNVHLEVEEEEADDEED